MRGLASRADVTLPAGALILTVIAFVLVPVYSGQHLATYDVFYTFERFAGLAFLTLGFGLVMIAGEFDLSIAGIYTLSGVIAADLGQREPLIGLLAATAICAAFGAVQGFIIARLRIPSMPVTLGTYIGLLGLATVIAHGAESVTFANASATLWIETPVFQILSPRSIVTLAGFALVAAVLSTTRWGRELRALGGDRLASRTSGLAVDRMLVGLFATSSALGAIAGALLTFSTGAAVTNPGATPVILAVAGALIGGVSLSGGQGTVAGLLAGALSIALIEQIFDITAYSDYITALAFGVVLLIVAAFDAPGLRTALVRLRAQHSTRRFSRAQKTR
jgi:ribose transport system permease protein